MNRRHDNNAGLPPPAAMHAGKDRLVHRSTVDRARGNNDGNKAEPATLATNQRCVAGIIALDQPAQITERFVQVGLSDQAAQPQSP